MAQRSHPNQIRQLTEKVHQPAGKFWPNLLQLRNGPQSLSSPIWRLDTTTFKKLDGSEGPIGFATLLENYHQSSQQHQINMLSNGHRDLSINKFEQRGNKGRGSSKTKIIVPICCLRHGHNMEKAAYVGWKLKEWRTSLNPTRKIQSRPKRR